MSENLLQLVSEELLPMLQPFNLRVTADEVADVFDNAHVVLAGAAVSIRVERDRGLVVVAVGPAAEPNTWFDIGLLMNYLGISSDPAVDFGDARGRLRGAGGFLQSMWGELVDKFDPQKLDSTKRELAVLKARRAERLFGPLNSHT